MRRRHSPPRNPITQLRHKHQSSSIVTSPQKQRCEDIPNGSVLAEEIDRRKRVEIHMAGLTVDRAGGEEAGAVIEGLVIGVRGDAVLVKGDEDVEGGLGEEVCDFFGGPGNCH